MVTGELKPPDACHCVQCRKWSGHIGVGADVPRSACTIYGEDQIDDGVPFERAAAGVYSGETGDAEHVEDE